MVKLPPLFTPTLPLTTAAPLMVTLPLPVSRMDQRPEEEFNFATARALRSKVLDPKDGSKQ